MIKNMINTKKIPTHFVIEMDGEKIIHEEIQLRSLVMNGKNEIHLVFTAEKQTIFKDDKTGKTISIHLE